MSTMSLDAFLRVAERFGVPVGLLVALVVGGVMFVRGPLMRFVEIVGQPLAQLVRAAIDFVSVATKKLEDIEHTVMLEAEKTRSLVSGEAATTRAHSAQLAEGISDRVRDAERATVTATGQHAAVTAADAQAALDASERPSRGPHPPIPRKEPDDEAALRAAGLKRGDG